MLTKICLLAILLAQLHCAFGCLKPLMDKLQSASLIGCFEDKSTDRDLPNRAGYSDDMTPMKCFSMCKLFKSNFIGLQRGNECWCGDEYGFHGAANNVLCSLTCAGDGKKVCGGKSQNSIYTGPFNGYSQKAKIEGEDSHLQ